MVPRKRIRVRGCMLTHVRAQSLQHARQRGTPDYSLIEWT